MAWTWTQIEFGPDKYEATRPEDAAVMIAESQGPGSPSGPDRPLFCLHGYPDGDTTADFAWEVLLNADDRVAVKKANPGFDRAEVEANSTPIPLATLQTAADEIGDSQLPIAP